MLRRFVVVAASATLLVLGAPAHAHVELDSSTPAGGASLATAPTSVRLVFTAPVSANPGSVKITAPDGEQWRVTGVEAAGTTVTADVELVGPTGPQTLAYRVTSDDGHIVAGTLQFTLKPSAAPTTTTTTAPPTTTTTTTADATQGTAVSTPAAPDEGMGAWLWVLGGGAPVLVVGAVALAARARS
ncbi:hypothetical protein GCM10023148_53540 [Actinokineospora soli]